MTFLCNKSQNVADGQLGHTITSLDSTTGTRRLSLLDQSNENIFTPSVFGHKYLELNLFDLRFLSEANMSHYIAPTSMYKIYQLGNGDPVIVFHVFT